MSDDIRIKTAERLAKCDGMEGSPWRLAEEYREYDRSKKIISIESNHMEIGHKYEFDIDRGHGGGPRKFRTILGLWLKIEDGNPWSSSAILARAGYHPGQLLRECPLAMRTFDCGLVEQSYIYMVCKLYEIDHTAYFKGIRPLMDEELQGIKVERPHNL